VPAAKSNVVQLNAGMNYLAKHSSTGVPMRFSKEGKFILPTEGDKELPEGTQLAVTARVGASLIALARSTTTRIWTRWNGY